jgi:hypothetical protein
MSGILIGQVIETGNLTYNIDPKVEEGKVGALGTIKVRLINDSGAENLEDVYARPLSLNMSFIPLNGEHVLLIQATSADRVSPNLKNNTFFYLPFPINATDDAVINQLSNATIRSTNKSSNSLQTDNPFIPGKSFPYPCKPLAPLQPFEGEIILQNRTGASIRLGTGTTNSSQYFKKPQHHKDTKPGDPTFAMTLERPGSPKLRPINDNSYPVNQNKSQSDKTKSQKYRIENLSNNLTGIFAGISQKYSKVRLGRGRRLETKGIPRYSDPQILLDTSRIVLNAKKDNLFMIAKDKAILEARKFYIATDEHNVDFDELVNRVQELAKELHRLTTAQAFYSTPFGPTGPASNLLQVLRIHLLCQKFHILPPNLFALPPEPRLDVFDFGINSILPFVINRRLLGGGGGSSSPGGAGAGPVSSPTDGGSASTNGQDSAEVQIRKDYINLINTITSKDITFDYDPTKDLPTNIDPNCGLPKSGAGCQVDSNGNIIKNEGDGIVIKQEQSGSIQSDEGLEETTTDVSIIDSKDECVGRLYEFVGEKFFGLTGAVRKVTYKIMLLVGNNQVCKGWYLVENDEYILNDDLKLTSDILADDNCIAENLQDKRCNKEEY